MTKKLTKKDFYNEIKNIIDGAERMIDDAEVIAFCDKEIAALAHKAEKAKERAATSNAANDELADIVRSVLTDEPTTIPDIAAKVLPLVEGMDVTVSKITYRLGKMVEAGEVESSNVKVAAGEGLKARTLKAYKLAD